MTQPISPEQELKHRLEDAVREFTEHHFDPAHVVVEYVLIVKTVKVCDQAVPARYLYAFKRNPDVDTLLGMIGRAKRYLQRTQDTR